MSRDEGTVTLTICGREVRVTHPEKLYFSRARKVTKLELVEYYLRIADGALSGIRGRPIVLKRFVDGAEAPPFYQKRAPDPLPIWVRSVTLSFPSGRTANEVVVDDAAGLIWMVNLGCIELHPHPVRTLDLDHPDELRIDLDPGPAVAWEDVTRVALEVNSLLGDHGLVGFPKTSGSRGMHVIVRIEPRWSFTELRRAALALAREVERRLPKIATSKWWKDERHGVFLDFNQNAKDRTTCSAYSVRPLPDARVSTPVTWQEVPDCDPADFTIVTVPKRFEKIGDPHADIDTHAGSLDGLLELAARDEAAGIPDAPWPQRYPARGRMAGVAASAQVRPAGKSQRRAALLVVAKSPDREAALAGLQRWLDSHAAVAAFLRVEDLLVDSMRGRSSNWTRIRVNLRGVPEHLRPTQKKPDPDDDPTRRS